MSATPWQPTAEDFAIAEVRGDTLRIVRPSISYWQDAPLAPKTQGFKVI
jgi:hypothetical protein